MEPVAYTSTNNEYVEVRESKIHGRGLFAKKDIPKGTKIIEYIGELITNDEADKRETENEKIGTTYICIFDDDYCIDGAVGGNESICANHSCDPNCELDELEGDNKMWVYAIKDIKKGEEMTYDYCYENYGDEKTPCHCKHDKCRGHMEEPLIQN